MNAYHVKTPGGEHYAFVEAEDESNAMGLLREDAFEEDLEPQRGTISELDETYAGLFLATDAEGFTIEAAHDPDAVKRRMESGRLTLP